VSQKGKLRKENTEGHMNDYKQLESHCEVASDRIEQRQLKKRNSIEPFWLDKAY
jgi:hypothetical protein